MPFVKGEPNDGRPKKSALWKEAQEEIRECLPRLLRMPQSLADKILSKENDPTLAMQLCYTYIKKYPAEVINRFLPESWANDPKVEKEISAALKDLVAAAGKAKTLNGHTATA